MLKEWQRARLLAVKSHHSSFRTLRFSVRNWGGHISGQHCDIRIPSAPNRGVRCYSIASSPDEKEVVEFGVEYFKEGSISPLLFDLEEGEEIEIRGPLGNDFLWDSKDGRLLFAAGGSGVVPFMSMLRHYVSKREKGDPELNITALLSFQDHEHILYANELNRTRLKFPEIKIVQTLTQGGVAGWNGFTGRFDGAMIDTVVRERRPDRALVCGSTGFVNDLSRMLREAGQSSFSVQYFG